jgi:hypothetical protein
MGGTRPSRTTPSDDRQGPVLFLHGWSQSQLCWLRQLEDHLAEDPHLGRSMTQPVRIEVNRRFGVPLREGFDYITDQDNWPQYWPDLVRIEPGSRWREPGDRARLVLRLLGRPVELEMTLGRLAPYSAVEYTSVQRGLPDARHERHFEDADGDLAYRIVVSYQPRPGWRSVFDRLLVRRGILRAARKTLANLDRRFSEAGAELQ